MNSTKLLKKLNMLKAELSEGIKIESFSYIESVHDELWNLSVDNSFDEEIKDRFSDIRDLLKSSYKNRDFDYAKEALQSFDDFMNGK